MPKLILLVVLFSGCATAKQPVVEWAFVEYAPNYDECIIICRAYSSLEKCEKECLELKGKVYKTGHVFRLEQVGNDPPHRHPIDYDCVDKCLDVLNKKRAP